MSQACNVHRTTSADSCPVIIFSIASQIQSTYSFGQEPCMNHVRIHHIYLHQIKIKFLIKFWSLGVTSIALDRPTYRIRPINRPWALPLSDIKIISDLHKNTQKITYFSQFSSNFDDLNTKIIRKMCRLQQGALIRAGAVNRSNMVIGILSPF